MINSAEEFISLRTSEDPDQYSRAARDEAPIEVWLNLVENYPEMRFWVAQNKTVPVEILETLITDEDPNVRLMVASKRKLPEQLQKKLAADVDDGVRHRIANHPKATREVLEMLLSDPWQEIRVKVLTRIESKDYQ